VYNLTMWVMIQQGATAAANTVQPQQQHNFANTAPNCAVQNSRISRWQPPRAG
jgi:hypothetical protein